MFRTFPEVRSRMVRNCGCGCTRRIWCTGLTSMRARQQKWAHCTVAQEHDNRREPSGTGERPLTWAQCTVAQAHDQWQSETRGRRHPPPVLNERCRVPAVVAGAHPQRPPERRGENAQAQAPPVQDPRVWHRSATSPSRGNGRRAATPAFALSSTCTKKLPCPSDWTHQCETAALI